LLDETHLPLVPVLPGEGIRLFGNMGTKHMELENIGVMDAPGVTHFRFRVVKQGSRNRIIISKEKE
jgi:hypothetical protein